MEPFVSTPGAVVAVVGRRTGLKVAMLLVVVVAVASRKPRSASLSATSAPSSWELAARLARMPLLTGSPAALLPFSHRSGALSSLRTVEALGLTVKRLTR